MGGESMRCLSIGFLDGNGMRWVLRTMRVLERSCFGTRISVISTSTAASIEALLRRAKPPGSRPGAGRS